MSDLNEWLKERRRIHDAATRGAWETSSAERDAFYNLPALLTAVENVLELLSPHYESQVRREAKFGRKGSACVCEVCRAMEAVEGAISEQ